MKRVSILLILTLVLAVTFCLAEMDHLTQMSLASNKPTNTTIVRHKRYLDFIPKSRMFVSSIILIQNNFERMSDSNILLQFRANVKANILAPPNQLLAFAYGYRANYPIENDIKIKRRDVYDSMQELIDQ